MDMTDFFEAGVEYDDATPYSAPEIIRTFRCVAVAEVPETNILIAFGFMCDNRTPWGTITLNSGQWARGWNRHLTVAEMTDATEQAATP